MTQLIIMIETRAGAVNPQPQQDPIGVLGWLPMGWGGLGPPLGTAAVTPSQGQFPIATLRIVRLITHLPHYK